MPSRPSPLGAVGRTKEAATLLDEVADSVGDIRLHLTTLDSPRWIAFPGIMVTRNAPDGAFFWPGPTEMHQ